MSESAIKIYHDRIKNGLCPNCGGKVKKSSPYKYCDACREYYRNYHKKNTVVFSANRREQYEEKKSKKLCPRCGIFLGKKSKTVLCQKCLDQLYLYTTGTKRPRKFRQ